jgi:hypothetical protein
MTTGRSGGGAGKDGVRIWIRIGMYLDQSVFTMYLHVFTCIYMYLFFLFTKYLANTSYVFTMFKIMVNEYMAIRPLDSLIPLEEEEKPSDIPGGICWFSSSP